MADPWKLTIPNCQWNTHGSFTAVITLSPCEKALTDMGLVKRDQLVSAYREAIERMDYRTFGIIGAAPAEVAEIACR